MSIRRLLYRNLKLLLVLVVTNWCTLILHGQNSEFDKLFKEAREQQYNNPNKSLDLYKYLLKTDLEIDAEFSVQIKIMHTYNTLGQYVQMVETLQELKKIAPNVTNKELLFEFWLEKALLYNNLSFPKQAKSSLLKAEELFEGLSNTQKDRNQKYLEYAYYSIEKIDNETDRVERLKTIQSFWNETEAVYDWFSYKLAEQYFDVDKDTSLYYFKSIVVSKNQLLIPIANYYIELLQNEGIVNIDSFDQLLGDDNLSFDLKISFIERIVNCYEVNLKLNELVLFTDILDKIKVEKTILNRQAKSLLLESVYYNKREAKAREIETETENQNLIVLGLSTLILGYLLYTFYRRKQRVVKAEKEDAKEAAKRNVIPGKTEEEILERLERFEKSTLYLDKQLRIADLAKYLKTNTRYLSVILNEKKNKSFNSYVNQLRVAYIIDKLHNEPIYLSYKISYLAKESGFASQSSFSSSFKEVAGMPPSAYIKTITDKKGE